MLEIEIKEDEIKKDFLKTCIRLWNVLGLFLVIPIIEIGILCLFYNLWKHLKNKAFWEYGILDKVVKFAFYFNMWYNKEVACEKNSDKILYIEKDKENEK